ncbi:SpoIIAA family protein [Dethiobacter alkaliphilus]|uniref:STAS/SEC14 domain-containing protein n=1 Tax=Dethiobacter alkaliphilus AHT 1 TaxID=555088 RepID=C0GKF7_DETAL|nr:STAS/SEC14 domain-containing protein [Dethiobacter alkaliphilus]EEG76200.1 conserved hypothetical protein [Dethiobacter alkaliphilus AHT 1]
MFRILETDVESVIEFEVKGDVTKKDYEKLEEAIQQKLAQTNSVNLLCRITELSSVTAEAIIKDFKVGVEHYKNINKMAVVGSAEWVQWMSKLGAVLPVDIKHFEPHQIDEAWEWVKE